METSILIAKIFAVVYVVVGLGMLLNYGYFKKMLNEMMKSAGFLYLGGIMALLAGFLIVNFHNVWVWDWTVIITVLGWLALLKGALLLLLPKTMVAFTRLFTNILWVAVVFVLVMAGVLGYFGFFA